MADWRFGSRVLNGADLPQGYYTASWPPFSADALDNTDSNYWGYYLVDDWGRVFQRIKASGAITGAGYVVALKEPVSGDAGQFLIAASTAYVADSGLATTADLYNDDLLLVQGSAQVTAGLVRVIKDTDASGGFTVSQKRYSTTTGLAGSDYDSDAMGAAAANRPDNTTPLCVFGRKPTVALCDPPAALSEDGLFGVPYGVALSAVTDGQFSWIQVGGPGLILADACNGTGDACKNGAPVIVKPGGTTGVITGWQAAGATGITIAVNEAGAASYVIPNAFMYPQMVGYALLDFNGATGRQLPCYINPFFRHFIL